MQGIKKPRAYTAFIGNPTTAKTLSVYETVMHVLLHRKVRRSC